MLRVILFRAPSWFSKSDFTTISPQLRTVRLENPGYDTYILETTEQMCCFVGIKYWNS